MAPSHVLTAIGLPREQAEGTLRITFGKNNTEQDVEYLVESIVETIKKY